MTPNLTAFSDHQLAGQRIMAGFEGTALTDDLKFLIKDLKVGGVILFSRNIDTPARLTQLCRSIQDYADQCLQPRLLIAVDQEGGQVARLKAPFTQFPGNPSMIDEQDARDFALTTATELSQAGINMNMAPVMDVVPHGTDSPMSGRVFGHDPNRAAALGTVIINTLQQNRIIAVAKHFPGIGRARSDSHVEMPCLDIDINTLKQVDLVPFQAAVRQGVGGVMLSHIRYDRIDPHWPAGLSEVIANDLLRKEMGYDGLIITDDLDMGAVKPHFSIKTMVRRIVSAHIDMALICHTTEHMKEAFTCLLRSLKESTETRDKWVRSVERILKLKRDYVSSYRGGRNP